MKVLPPPAPTHDAKSPAAYQDLIDDVFMEDLGPPELAEHARRIAGDDMHDGLQGKVTSQASIIYTFHSSVDRGDCVTFI